MHQLPVRHPAVAGTFYPDEASRLARMVVDLLAAARARVPVDPPHVGPKALIVPHAGYVYSGPTAALGFAQLALARQPVRRIVLLGPAHRVPVRGLALPGARAYATPLGEVRIDLDAAHEISRLPQVTVSPAAHALEHSLEVQVPFLQTVLEDVVLLPLVVGEATPSEVADVLDAAWAGPDTLVVVSSDLSHYHPYPEARALDEETVERILSLDGPVEPSQACGARPVNGLLRAARTHGLTPHLLELCSSGDTAGDRRRVVGYASIAFTR